MRTQANRLAITLSLTALLIATVFSPAICLADGGLDLSQQITAEDAAAGDLFGFSLAINTKRANCIAVAARRADTEIGKDTGSVYSYVYDRAARLWNLDQILLPEDLLRDDEFGQSLAMDPIRGDWLFVGADQSTLAEAEKAGAIYFFTRENDQP